MRGIVGMHVDIQSSKFIDQIRKIASSVVFVSGSKTASRSKPHYAI